MERSSARRRPGRPHREAGSIQQSPWTQLTRPYQPIEVLSTDQVQHIHEAGLSILEEVGMRVLLPEARRLFKAAGADVDEGEMRVRFDRAMIMERIATAPASFELRARNPQRNLKVGGRHCILSSVGGPAYVMDNDRGRRTGTYAEMCDYLKLIQSFNILHQEGGGPFEPLDLHANTRHLDLYYAEITLLDKNWQPQTLGTGVAAYKRRCSELKRRSLQTITDLVAELAAARSLDVDVEAVSQGLYAITDGCWIFGHVTGQNGPRDRKRYRQVCLTFLSAFFPDDFAPATAVPSE